LAHVLKNCSACQTVSAVDKHMFIFNQVQARQLYVCLKSCQIAGKR